MLFARHAVAVFCAALFTTASAAPVPLQGEHLRQTHGSAPTYVHKDKEDQVYALQLGVAQGKSGESEYRLWKKYLNEDDFKALSAMGASLRYLPDLDIGDSGTGIYAIDQCTTTQFPTDFNIQYVNGSVVGNVGVCQTNTRPPGTHTQWLDFVVFTWNYYGNAAHTPVVPWFKSTIHGHGMYFGDTSTYPCLNGQDTKYNTRIEGWSQWYGFDPGPSSYWTSTGPSLTDTCGATWVDGWVPGNYVTTQYNVNVHASDGQWVQYLVNRWNGAAWVTHTPPVVRNMTYSSWPTSPGVFDPAANGMFIGSTPPLGQGVGGNWTIAIRSLTVGWF